MLISNVNKLPDQPNHTSLVVSSLFFLVFAPFLGSSPCLGFELQKNGRSWCLTAIFPSKTCPHYRLLLHRQH